MKTHHLRIMLTMLSVCLIGGCAVVGNGTCAGDETCGGGNYCRFEDGMCNESVMVGVCEIRPEICTQQFAPVCGCDGETYANRCFAAAAGVSVNFEGECQ